MGNQQVINIIVKYSKNHNEILIRDITQLCIDNNYYGILDMLKYIVDIKTFVDPNKISQTDFNKYYKITVGANKFNKYLLCTKKIEKIDNQLV